MNAIFYRGRHSHVLHYWDCDEVGNVTHGLSVCGKSGPLRLIHGGASCAKCRHELRRATAKDGKP